ncbi:AraC family transcriptional regulator [Paenibacillus arenilitoris]|uniref:Helix-turn-helix transcriptional regulator n=1 Tax=Paenibacillus arenilitoris TaxID=2772299 RepID=A0A927CTQ8_9BACL|nr:AraC family transcriptional regulator [Paenibacillus arenilitoris]MBD2871405.1 helix-turn-helix transcriptional regulator [Paenibacillus arenilitoris]
MTKLSEMTPYVGDSMPYRYDGSSNEKLRVCSVYAFHLFTDGPGEMEINGKRYPIDNRTIIFLRPGEPHAFHISAERPLTSYNLYCDLWDPEAPVSVNRTFIYAPEPFLLHETSLAPPCEELDGLPSVFSLQPYPELFDAFLRLARIFNELHHYRNEAMGSLLYAWILSWYNTIHTHQPTDYRIVRLLHHLNEHPERGESVESWWAFCGLKRTYFHELFLRETGLTPRAYHHKLLMRRAAHLLRESDLTVTAIAERLGYPSIHPFTRHFRGYYGVSPRSYRRHPQNLL